MSARLSPLDADHAGVVCEQREDGMWAVDAAVSATLSPLGAIYASEVIRQSALVAKRLNEGGELEQVLATAGFVLAGAKRRAAAESDGRE